MGYFYPNGLSDKAGAHYLLRKPIYTSAIVRFVNSESGDDTYQGMYNTPKATIASAESALGVLKGGIIVLQTEHDETVTANMSLNAGTALIGETSTGGIPDAKLTLNSSTDSLTVAGDGHQFINVRLPPQDTANAAASRLEYLTGTQIGFRMLDCLVEVDINDNYDTVVAIADGILQRCTFKSTALTVATQVLQYVFGMSNGYVMDCAADLGVIGPVILGEDVYIETGTEMTEMALLNGASIDADATSLYHFAETDSAAYLESSTNTSHGPFSATATDVFVSEQIHTNGVVRFVDSSAGTDSGSGVDINSPLATLAYAVSLCTAGDVIVLRSTHNEVITSQVAITTDRLTIVGETRDATLDIQVASTEGVDITADNCKIRNVSFVSNGGSPVRLLAVNGRSNRVSNCTLESGSAPALALMQLGNVSEFALVDGCTFTNTANITYGLELTSNYGLTVLDCTFDGGSAGYALAAIYATSGDLFRFEKLKLKNRAGVYLGTTVTGYVHLDSIESNCKIEVF